MQLYDLIIIGAGPAGMTAAVYAARKRLNFMVIANDVGGQPLWNSAVENYLGYSYISGVELVKKFEEHIKKYKTDIKMEKVTSIEKTGKAIRVKTEKSSYESKTVIIASGKKPRQLNVPGEKEFFGKGVTYCATCDAPLFTGNDVAVIGGGNSALDACIQLTKIANKIYLIDIEKKLRADIVLVEKIENAVIVFNSTKVLEITGNKFVSGVIIEKENKHETLAAQGVFIEIGMVPNSDFADIVKKNEMNEILISKKNETSVPGIFAAGDVTDVPGKQIIVAAGEGAKAALAAAEYISRN
jgi:alkyl hydroperoxide reductase subunit F